jgi:hypothetical protein
MVSLDVGLKIHLEGRNMAITIVYQLWLILAWYGRSVCVCVFVC